MNIAVAGIHTGIGKTICSAILSEALGFDYWKPVQAGELENTDSMIVESLVSNPEVKIHKESFRLKLAASPHWAAREEGKEIILEDIKLPTSNNNIIIETAGGLMSPLSDTIMNIDLLKYFNLPTILVSNNYLGSINHTLLSVEAMQKRGIRILGVVFNGERNTPTEQFILQYTKLHCIFRMPVFDELKKSAIHDFALTIKQTIHDLVREG